MAAESSEGLLAELEVTHDVKVWPPCVFRGVCLRNCLHLEWFFFSGDGQPEDIGYGFQKSGGGLLEAAAAAGLPLSNEPIYAERKRNPSVFRERADVEREDHGGSAFRERAGRLAGRRDRLAEEDYLAVLAYLLDKYKSEIDPEDTTEADVDEMLAYLEEAEKPGYEELVDPAVGSYVRAERPPQFDDRYAYATARKRYPIAKRSPASATVHRHKKSVADKRTDPETVARLSDIFSAEKKDEKNANHTTPKPSAATTGKANTTARTRRGGQKELSTPDANSLKPVQVKKKSIALSDYFGIDRRKKSMGSAGRNFPVNEDWLLNKYLAAYGVGGGDDKSPEDVDSKMRAVEEMMLDDAIKYTGAHEGTTDRQEIKEVKDRVMARLAAAYGLEKIRQALGSFKAQPPAHKEGKTFSFFPRVIAGRVICREV